jgi:hypothetical protein
VGRFTFGVILGLAIGILDVLLMLPLAFPLEPQSDHCHAVGSAEERSTSTRASA